MITARQDKTMSGMAMRRTPLTKFFNPGGQAWLRLHHTNLVLLGLGLDHPDLLLLVGLGIQRTDVVLIHLELRPCLCHQLCQFMFGRFLTCTYAMPLYSNYFFEILTLNITRYLNVASDEDG